jgi:Raf kinase inhibitor-like YbhB/YbcL family protein
MKIISSAFENETLMDVRFTCNGENVNPSLEFVGVPEEAVSLVLIMDDPDAPAQVREDRLWVHWVKFNIPATTRVVEENSEPEGAPGVNTSKTLDYRGPCPPDRQHRYFFKLYALDTMLYLPEGSTKKEVEQAMEGRVIEQAELIGLYEQPDKMKTM